MDIIKYRDYIGVYAPILLFILSLFLLINKRIYLQLYVCGFLLNNILNIILKQLIQDPRPSKDKKTLEVGIKNGARVGYNKFGMPSGHAQNCGYNFSYITFSLNNPFLSLLYLLISFISLYQRYIYNNHSILQLFIGFIVGCIFGYLIYWIGEKYLKGNLKLKKDDNGPR